MNAVILRTLPVPNPQQLFIAEKVTPAARHWALGWPSFEQARTDVQGRAEFCAYTARSACSCGRTPPGTRRRIAACFSSSRESSSRSSGNRHRSAGCSDQKTIADRGASRRRDQRRLWERHFARSTAVLGRQLVINGTNVPIVGVAAREFFGPVLGVRNPDLWVPLMMQHTLRYSSNASVSIPADLRQPWPPQELIQWLQVFVRVPRAKRPRWRPS